MVGLRHVNSHRECRCVSLQFSPFLFPKLLAARRQSHRSFRLQVACIFACGPHGSSAPKLAWGISIATFIFTSLQHGSCMGPDTLSKPPKIPLSLTRQSSLPHSIPISQPHLAH